MASWNANGLTVSSSGRTRKKLGFLARLAGLADLAFCLDTHATAAEASILARAASGKGCELVGTGNPDACTAGHVGGVCVLAKRTFLRRFSRVRFHEVFPGRALSVELTDGSGTVQVVGCYLSGPTDRTGISWPLVLEAIVAARTPGAKRLHTRSARRPCAVAT